MEGKKYNTNRIPSLVIAFFTIISFYAGTSWDFQTSPSLKNALLYHFSHANIFHLSINVWMLIRFQPRIHTIIVSYIVSSLVALIPFVAMNEPTCGLSAFIFALYARKFYYHRMKLYMLVIVNIGISFLPHINGKVHLAAFFLSYAYWIIYDCIHTYRKGVE